MSLKQVASSTAYSKLQPPYPNGSRWNGGYFRVDATTGEVRCAHEDDDLSDSSTDSDDNASVSVSTAVPPNHTTAATGSGAAATTTTTATGGRKRSTMFSEIATNGAATNTSSASAYPLVPFGESQQHSLRIDFAQASYLRPRVVPAGARCAPTGVGCASLVGFSAESSMVLFGGAEHVKPVSDTWVYSIPDKRWHFVDPMEIVPEHVANVRRRRGYGAGGVGGERAVPLPRSGHSAVPIRDVPDPTVVDLQTLREVPHLGAPTTEAATAAGASTAAPSPRTVSSLNASIGEFGSQSDYALSPSASSKYSQTTRSVGGQAHSGNPAASWSYEPSMLVFGGADLPRGVYYNDLWQFDLHTRAWRELKPLGKAPSPRWLHTAVVLEQRMFVFGGESETFEVLQDLHVYDHLAGSWRAVRNVQPIPPRRMMHAAVVVKESMVVIGGIGSQSHNASLIDIAVDQGVHLSGSIPASSLGQRRTSSTLRRASGASTSALAPPPPREELSDVWILDLRTLVWREAAKSNKFFSPFLVRLDVGGGGTAGGEHSSALELPGPPVAAGLGRLEFKSLEGHSAAAFDERVLVIGGKLNGKVNRRVFSLHLPTETWAYLGDLPAATSDGTLPIARSGSMICAMVDRSTLQPMRDAVHKTLLTSSGSSEVLSDEASTVPLLQLLAQRQAKQISFDGMLGTYGSKPIISHTVCAYLFGGFVGGSNGVGIGGGAAAAGGRGLSDLWRIELVDEKRPSSFEQLFGSSVNALLEGARVTSAASRDGGGYALSTTTTNPLTAAQQAAAEAYVLGSTILSDIRGKLRTIAGTTSLNTSGGAAGLQGQTGVRRQSHAMRAALGGDGRLPSTAGVAVRRGSRAPSDPSVVAAGSGGPDANTNGPIPAGNNPAATATATTAALQSASPLPSSGSGGPLSRQQPASAAAPKR